MSKTEAIVLGFTTLPPAKFKALSPPPPKRNVFCPVFGDRICVGNRCEENWLCASEAGGAIRQGRSADGIMSTVLHWAAAQTRPPLFKLRFGCSDDAHADAFFNDINTRVSFSFAQVPQVGNSDRAAFAFAVHSRWPTGKSAVDKKPAKSQSYGNC